MASGPRCYLCKNLKSCRSGLCFSCSKGTEFEFKNNELLSNQDEFDSFLVYRGCRFTLVCRFVVCCTKWNEICVCVELHESNFYIHDMVDY